MIFLVVSIANCNDMSDKKIKIFYSHVSSKLGKILKSLTLSLSLSLSLSLPHLDDYKKEH